MKNITCDLTNGVYETDEAETMEDENIFYEGLADGSSCFEVISVSQKMYDKIKKEYGIKK